MGVNTEVTAVTREIVQELDAVIAGVRTELARLDLADMGDKAIVDRRQDMELTLTAVADRNLESLAAMTEDLRAPPLVARRGRPFHRDDTDE